MSTRRVGRPLLGERRRKLIAIRVDPDVLDDFRKEALARHVGYQTLINEILAEHVGRNPMRNRYAPPDEEALSSLRLRGGNTAAAGPLDGVGSDEPSKAAADHPHVTLHR